MAQRRELLDDFGVAAMMLTCGPFVPAAVGDSSVTRIVSSSALDQ